MRAAGFQATAWSGWTDAGRGAGRGDPRVARCESLPRRGPSQDLGAAALRRRPHRQTPRPAADARARLLAPNRIGRRHGPKAHDGTIRTERVDEMWGTDLTSTMTGEGQASIFVTVDHCSTECVGIHAARRATRFEALEPLRQGVRTAFGSFAGGIAGGRSSATTTAVSSSPTTTSASSPSSASRARRLSCASPRATAVSSASSGPSRRTCCGSAA